MTRDQVVIINMSGRGDKDVQQVAQFFAARGGEGLSATEGAAGSRLNRPGRGSDRLVRDRDSNRSSSDGVVECGALSTFIVAAAHL